MIIGITGGTGCGKTTLLAQIAKRGGIVLDCDAIYHQLLTRDDRLLTAIDARFPGVVADGKLERRKLGAIVFEDEKALLDLNRITHGAVKAEVIRRLEPKPELAAIDAIALFEGGLAELCDVTVAVTAPEDIRVNRLMARDNITREYALARIRAQKPTEYFVEHCDYALENGEKLEDFQSKCSAFLDSLLT